MKNVQSPELDVAATEKTPNPNNTSHNSNKTDPTLSLVPLSFFEDRCTLGGLRSKLGADEQCSRISQEPVRRLASNGWSSKLGGRNAKANKKLHGSEKGAFLFTFHMQDGSKNYKEFRRPLRSPEERSQKLIGRDVGQISDKPNIADLEEQCVTYRQKEYSAEKSLIDLEENFQRLHIINETIEQQMALDRESENYHMGGIKTERNESEKKCIEQSMRSHTLNERMQHMEDQLKQKDELLKFYIMENETLKQRGEDFQRLLDEKIRLIQEDNSYQDQVCSTVNLSILLEPQSPRQNPISPVGSSRKLASIRSRKRLNDSMYTKLPNTLNILNRGELKKANSCGSFNLRRIVRRMKERYSETCIKKMNGLNLVTKINEDSRYDLPQASNEFLKDIILRDLKDIEEKIKFNNLQRNAEALKKEVENLSSYKKDVEALQLEVGFKNQIIKKLEENLEEQRNLALDLKCEVETGHYRYKEMEKTFNTFISKPKETKNAQIETDMQIIKVGSDELLYHNLQLAKENQKLKLQFKKQQDLSRFLAESKESLEKVWEENEIIVKQSEEALQEIFLKLNVRPVLETCDLSKKIRHLGKSIDKLCEENEKKWQKRQTK